MTSASTATEAARAATLAALDEPVDVLVIGGGVNGLAVAWDAALAGLRVAVIDKGDWGSGTSSWSSRMIHGGLKYLEKRDVRLVRESLRDREWLLRQASHLVKPLPFVLPSYGGDAHSRAAIRLGMLAYDVLSFDKSTPRHENFARQDVIERLPGLRREGLRGASRYYDAQVEYAERLSVELMLGARAAGAIPINYAAATALELDGNRVVGARVVDALSGDGHVARSAVTINLAGAWVDSVLAGTPLASTRLIGGTKGTHLVVEPFAGAPDDALYYESRDHRPMMVIPWLGRYLIGSTDKPFTGDLDTATADAEEIEYILFETNKAFPSAGLTRDDILYWYSGVRPLPFVSGGRPGDISRRHEVLDHAPKVEGLVSVVGGKLTTFRALAEHTLEVVRRKIRAGPSRLHEQRFPGAPGERGASAAPSPDRLTRIYGQRASEIRKLMRSEPDTAREIHGATGLVAAEVVFSVREEQAVRLSDILARRTMVGLEPDLGRAAARPAAVAAAPELGWSEPEIERELAAHERYLRRFEVLEGPA